MCRSAVLAFVPTAIFAFVTVPTANAQLPRRLEDCLPNPSLADDLRARRGEARQRPEVARAKLEMKVRVVEVTIGGTVRISRANLEEWIESLKKLDLDANSNWIDRVAEVEARGFWNDRGFFQAQIQATPKLLGWDGTTQLVAVALHVSEGRQFRTSDITFVGNPIFSERDLRGTIPLQREDVFDVSKIRQGMEALQRLYGEEGYMDFTVEPITYVYPVEERDYISLRLELHEGNRFYFGGVEILGEHPGKERLLEWNRRSGEVFRRSLVEEFLEASKSVLSPNFSRQDLHVRRDVKRGLAYFVFDFRTCP